MWDELAQEVPLEEQQGDSGWEGPGGSAEAEARLAAEAGAALASCIFYGVKGEQQQDQDAPR